jgi:muconolactone delta-isomerase
MYRVTYYVDHFSGPLERARVGRALQRLVDALVLVDLDFLEHEFETPSLYASGVLYQPEPPGRRDWFDIQRAKKEGHGGVETLAAWRAAELQKQGIAARPVFEWRSAGELSTYHVLVRWPNGQLEDPSRRLAMGSAEIATSLGSTLDLARATERPIQITFHVDLFSGPLERARSGRALEIMLEALVALDLDYLQHHPETPTLYASGVRYEAEPPGREDWTDVLTTLRRGYGDCEDLASWRVAELQKQGIAARPVHRWRSREGFTTYHILAQWPNGRIEDPSRRLGMGRSRSVAVEELARASQ